MAAKYCEVCSEVYRGNEAIVIWRLKDWEKGGDSQFLSSNASCSLDIDSGPELNNIRARLRFYFHRPPNNGLGLYMDHSPNIEDQIAQFEVKVDLVDDKLNVINADGGRSISQNKLVKVGEPSDNFPLTKEFLSWKNLVLKYQQARPMDMRLMISVTPVFILNVSSILTEGQGELPDHASSSSPSAAVSNLKQLPSRVAHTLQNVNQI